MLQLLTLSLYVTSTIAAVYEIWIQILMIKALKIRYILMDCHLVDIHSLSKAFVEARNWNFDIKPTDGVPIFDS